ALQSTFHAAERSKRHPPYGLVPRGEPASACPRRSDNEHFVPNEGPLGAWANADSLRSTDCVTAVALLAENPRIGGGTHQCSMMARHLLSSQGTRAEPHRVAQNGLQERLA